MTSTSMVQSEVGNPTWNSGTRMGLQAGSDSVRVRELEAALRASEERLAAELADTRLLQELSAQLVEQGNEAALCTKLVDAIATVMRSDFATMQMLYPDRGARGELASPRLPGTDPGGRKTLGVGRLRNGQHLWSGVADRQAGDRLRCRDL